MLAAVRCGEMQPIMLARTIATLDHMLEGRLTINIISSDFPRREGRSAYRYQRSREVVEILRQAWTQDEINYEGEVYSFKGLTTDPGSPTSRTAARCCISAAIRPTRWNCAASIATST